jgi:chromosome partitioning protein
VPTIAFISPKGGVGKTTSATLLATELARKARVTVIDADPNKPIEAWAKLAGKPESLSVVSNVTQDTIIEQIEEAAKETEFVVVDCEGTASLTVAYAIGQADLVIIPLGGSQLDAKQASRALRLVEAQEKQGRRKIPHAVVFTRTSPAIRPRTLAHIETEMAERGVRIFNEQLHERESFRAMFSFGGTLEGLDPTKVPSVDKAIANARGFAKEVLAMLKEAQAAPEAA